MLYVACSYRTCGSPCTRTNRILGRCTRTDLLLLMYSCKSHTVLVYSYKAYNVFAYSYRSCTVFVYPYRSCLNGGTCYDGVGTFACSCPPEFSGPHCQHRLLECDRDPCLNEGTCQDLPDGRYRCHCPYGLTGARCDVRARYFWRLNLLNLPSRSITIWTCVVVQYARTLYVEYVTSRT